jgi:hypothetical protein
MMASMGIYGSSGRVADPLSGLGVIIGVVGAVLAAILWLYHFQPESQLMGSYSAQISFGELGEQLSLLAGALGAMAIIAGIGSSLGGRGRGLTVAALLLGVFAMSYPVLTYLHVFSRVVPSL